MNQPLRNIDESRAITDDPSWYFLIDEIQQLLQQREPKPARLESASLTATDFNMLFLRDPEQLEPVNFRRPVGGQIFEDAAGEMLAPNNVVRLQVVVHDRGTGKFIVSD
jgi:hypothetical protein